MAVSPGSRVTNSNPYGKGINLDQFNVPGNSENDDFDQVYAANVQSVKKSTPPVSPTPGKVLATPLATPAKVDVQSQKTAIAAATPPPGYISQTTPSPGHVQSGKVTPLTSDDVTQATSPPSPGEKIVLMFGPKPENVRWHQRDYVIGGTPPRHVTKNTTSPYRYVMHIS